MSFQAYLDEAEAKTGTTPQQLVDEAGERGLTEHADVLTWCEDDYGLRTGHARALAHVVVHGPVFEVRQTTGTHRDESGVLRLNGIANRSTQPGAQSGSATVGKCAVRTEPTEHRPVP
jgi:hypothetical protein